MYVCMYTHICTHKCICLYVAPFLCSKGVVHGSEISSCNFRVKSGNSLLCGEFGKPVHYSSLRGERVWGFCSGKGLCRL